MEITLSSQKNLPLLRVKGDIDMGTAPRFDAALKEHSGDFHSSLLIDLSECAFMDSGALNILLQAVRRLDGQAWLGVVGANRNLRRVFDIVALTADPRFRLLEVLPQAGG
jgi:anti-sigma B factor antagonist